VTGKDPQSQLDSALAACGRLHEENARLRRLLSEHGISLPEPPETAAQVATTKPENDRSAVDQASDPEVKIALFRSLFGGREDVYAVRWEAPDGRSSTTGFEESSKTALRVLICASQQTGNY